MSYSKKVNQRHHAKKRALERFGVSINREDYRKINDLIRTGIATFVKKESNRVSLFNLTYNGIDMCAVYDTVRHQVVTFLPRKET